MKRSNETKSSASGAEIKKPRSESSQKPRSDDSQKSSVEFIWTPEEELCLELNLNQNITKNICRLLEDGNSIPFIARYRKEQTGGMDPDTLRTFKESFEGLKSVQEKSVKLIHTVEKTGKLTPAVRNSFLSARSAQELEVAYAPYKTGSKSSLAERARALGLGDVALDILEGLSPDINLSRFVDSKVQGRSKLSDVETGILHIIADIIVHDKDISAQIRAFQKQARITLDSKQSTTKSTKEKKPAAGGKSKPGKEENPLKFENYFQFSCPVNFVKSHQILAINRGESLKILSVKVNLPEDWLMNQLIRQVQFRWLNRGRQYPARTSIVENALKDAFKRLISPLMIRTCRSELTKMAENDAILNFAENLRKLLLTPPFRGFKILSIDPGFSHGCKLAVISESGDVIDTGVIYPRFKDPRADEQPLRILCDMVQNYEVGTIAIGNGTGCRETQELVSYAIEAGRFNPVKVRYTIVEERGASIYSCSPLASQEFPKMDTNIISAVSLGRRLQDPLSEYVKIEPHHLGCGMYQHDVSQTKLNTALDEIVVECVSFVGVNLNSCSEHLLRRIAGLTAARAKSIVEFRRKNGDFKAREDLKLVKGIGGKVFEQCSGFLRISKSTKENGDGPEKPAKPAKSLKKSGKSSAQAGGADWNPLDATNIHPESYQAATELVKLAGAVLEEIGSNQFVNKITSFVCKQNSGELATRLNIGLPTLDLIIGSLKQDLEYDYRQEFGAPIFRNGMTRLEDIHPGNLLTGRVSNVTAFGAFVDIGIGKDGLIHISKMRGRKVELGNRVEVRLLSKDTERGKISLELVNIL